MPRLALSVLPGLVLISVCSFAQGPRSNSYGSASGYGSVAYPGTGHPPGASSAPRRLGSTDGTYSWRPYANRARRSGVAAYPVYVGGFYSGYGDPSGGYGPSDPSAEPNVTIVNAPPAAPAPPVIINQYFGTPPPQGEDPGDQNIHFYSQSDKQPAAEASSNSEPRTYLIAYKDHSVYSALAYWLEDHTLNYVTMQNTHNQADLSLIDLEFTKKLNSDRSMPFSLAPPR